MECSHCGGDVHLDDDQPDDASSAGQGADGDTVWCSDVCRQVVVDGRWPTPAGPASHDQIVAWMGAQQREDGIRLSRQRDAEAAEQAKFQKAVDAAVARALAERGG